MQRIHPSESKIGVINYNFSDFQPEELFRWCAENGVKYVELQRKDIWPALDKSENKVKELRMFLSRYDIKVSQISTGSDFLQKTEEEMEREIWMVGEMCEMVKDLGFNQLRIDGGWPKEGVNEEDYRELIMTGISRVTEIAEAENVYLALDNHGIVTNNILFQLDILETVNSRFLGANLDTMNYRWYGYSVEELPGIYRQIAPYVLHTHLKDGTGSKDSYTGTVLGKGEIPIIQAMNIIKKAGYNGVWCIEYEGKEGVEGYKQSLEWLEQNKV